MRVARYSGSPEYVSRKLPGLTVTRHRDFFVRAAAVAVGLAALLPGSSAGPPFRTDDPGPVEYQHYEFNTFTERTHISGDTVCRASPSSRQGSRQIELAARTY